MKLNIRSFFIWHRGVPGGVAAMAIAGFLALYPPAATAGRSGWRILSTPSTGNINQLNATTAISPSDAWAVGTTGVADFNSQGVTQHWDGHAWSVIPSPNPIGATFVNLLGVAGASADDVWAVGRWETSGDPFVRPFALHWDGSAWSVVNTPALQGATFQAVTTISPNDAWAVGQAGAAGLTEHWDGQSWSVVPSPKQQRGGDLTAVGGTSSSDIWAVGSFFDNRLEAHSMILHWDGAAWSITPSPDTGASSELEGVSAVSSSDVWAVGHSFPSNVATLAEHWDGTSWIVVPGPNVLVSQFHGVAVVSSSDVWAVGSALGPNAQLQTLAEKWNGSAWVVSRTPNVNQVSEFLGVTATSRAILAVGEANATPQSPQQTLAESHAP